MSVNGPEDRGHRAPGEGPDVFYVVNLALRPENKDDGKDAGRPSAFYIIHKSNSNTALFVRKLEIYACIS